MNPGTIDPYAPSAYKVFFVSLGCAKNQVDTEIMLYALQEKGFSLTQEADEAEVVVINTCSFIESAVQESIETILEAARLKQEGACKVLAVTGCFPQRYKRKLVKQMPEVDLFLGTESFPRLATHLWKLLSGKKTSKISLTSDGDLWGNPQQRLLTTWPGTAYLKIAEGCSNHCSYCTIPTIRGPFRSRDPQVLIREARDLVARGVREIILIGQDITAYGADLNPPFPLEDLTRFFLKNGSFDWLRLLYLRPERITRDLLDLIAGENKICPYLDIPIQHASDRVLKAMHRPYGHKDLDTLMQKIRKTVPQAALRTTLMVGFPGETEADFQELLNFVSEVRFDHLGVFQYSPEEGTTAAALPDQIPKEISRSRLERLMEKQKGISYKKNQERVGTVEPVLVSGTSPESDLLIIGHTRFQAPDVDGVVYITDGEPAVGEIVRVKINEAHDYDLVGEVVS
ncbi:MAG: 30S ribosomal protein S12 methylthiotransferase RimO [Thermodesulfobacteriota bacterium]